MANIQIKREFDHKLEMAAYHFHPIFPSHPKPNAHASAMVAVSVTTAATHVHVDRSKQTSIYSLHLSPNGFPPKHGFQLRVPIDLSCDAGSTHRVTAVIVNTLYRRQLYVCSRTSQRNDVRRRKIRIKFNFFLPCFSSFHCRPDKVHIYLNLWLIDTEERDKENRNAWLLCVAEASQWVPRSVWAENNVPVFARTFDEYLLASEFYRFVFFLRCLDLIRIFCAERTRTTRILLLWHLTRCQIQM